MKLGLLVCFLSLGFPFDSKSFSWFVQSRPEVDVGVLLTHIHIPAQSLSCISVVPWLLLSLPRLPTITILSIIIDYLCG